MLKKSLIGFAAVLVLLLGGLLIAPSFIDWNARLPEITQQVKQATGRDLSVDGRLEVRILPAPMLTARGITLGNVPGAKTPDMVALEAVEVRVALLPLLSGEVQVSQIRLVKPDIVIEKYPDGSTNLEFTSQAPAAQQEPQAANMDGDAAANGGGLGVRLDNFEIIDGRVSYVDVASGSRETVEDINAVLRAGSLEGPFDALGEARVRGVPLSFEASLGEIIAGRTIPINARLSAPGRTQADISGAVLEMETAPRFKGRVKIDSADMAQLLDAVTGAKGTSPALSRAVGLETAVEATPGGVTLGELEITLDGVRATGQASAAWEKGVRFDVALSAARVDADALLAGMKSDSGAPVASGGSAGSTEVASAPPKNGAKGRDAGFVLPKDVNGRVAIDIGAVTYRGGLMSDVRLNAELADGELALNQLQVSAPGVTDVAVFGFVRPEEGQPRFNGDMEIMTADPKGLAGWLGVAVPEGVAGRVKRVSLKSKISADQTLVTLSDLRLTGDRTKVTGGVTVALRARPSFGADLTVNELDLDTYLNGANGVSASASTDATASQAAAPKAAPSKTEQAMDMAAAWAVAGALNDFDANLKLRLERLISGGQTFKGLSFDGTLYAGTLDLRRFALADMQGASTELKGKFTGFGGVPEMTGVQASTTVKDVNAFARALGLQGLPKGLGRVDMTMDAEGSLIKPRFTTVVKALDGQYGLRGRFSLLPIGFGYDGEVSLSHPDAAKLAARLGYVPTGPLGALDLKANAKTDGKVHELTNIQGAIGATAIAGQVNADTGKAKPVVVADLKTGVLDIQAFLAKGDKRADAATSGLPRHARGQSANPLLVLASMPGTEIAQASANVDKRWSREQFDLSALENFNGEVTLKSDAIKFGTYRLDAADVHAVVQDGVLTADRVVGFLFGGPVSGSAVVRAKGSPTIHSRWKIDAMEIQRAVQAVAGKDLGTGKLGLNLDFAATGLSPAELVRSLSGNGALAINGLDVKQGGTGTALAPVIGLVATMNQFALPAAGSKPKAGLADLSLDFNIRDGIADISKMALTSALGAGSGTGKVDIAGWAIDFTGNMTVEPNLLTSLLSQGRVGRQEVPFSLNGRLDKPGVKMGIRPAGSTTQPSPQTVPQDPVKGLLQNVLPGVIPQQKPQQRPQQQPAPQPSTQGDGTLAPPPPQQNQAPSGAPSQPQKTPMSPEDMIKQLMQGL